MRANISAGENFLEVLEERSVDRHHILKMPVLRAILHHQALSVTLDALGFYLYHFFSEQNVVRQLAIYYLLSNLRDSSRAQRVRRARPAQRRLRLLI